MSKFWQITFFAAGLFFLSPLAALAQDSFPVFPASFYGTATLNGNKLPAGTKIQAYEGSVLKGEAVINEDGVYGYDSPTKKKLVVGVYSSTGLTFVYVPAGMSNGLAGDSAVIYSEAFVSGSSTELDLTFTKNALALTSTSNEAVITAADTATTTIAIDATATAPKINFSSLLTSSFTDSRARISGAIRAQSSTSQGILEVEIPAGTTITAPTGWSGVINAPTLKSNNSVTVAADSGKTATVGTVVEVGYDDVKLILDKAARLVLPGQAGKDAGYSSGGSFTKISAVCGADTQASGDSLPNEGECKIDVGSDLVIWTKHFTSFIAYTQTDTPPVNNGGGGGGGGAPYTPPVVDTPDAEDEPEEPKEATGQVLGARIGAYPDGALLKADGDAAVWYISGGQKHLIRSAAIFESRFNWDDIIHLPSSDQLNLYEQGADVQFAAGTLVKEAGSPDVYRVSASGGVAPIISGAVFLGRGYVFNDVVEVEAGSLAGYQKIAVIDSLGSIYTGDLIKIVANPAVYYVENNTARVIPSADIFFERAFNFRNVRTIYTEQFNKLAKGANLTYPDGTLVKGESSSVYIIANGTKRPILSAADFEGLFYKWDNIRYAPDALLADIPLDTPIRVVTSR